jgi:hypothetical protein
MPDTLFSSRLALALSCRSIHLPPPKMIVPAVNMLVKTSASTPMGRLRTTATASTLATKTATSARPHLGGSVMRCSSSSAASACSSSEPWAADNSGCCSAALELKTAPR